MARDLKKLRAMEMDELRREELSLRDAIWKLRLQRATGALDRPQKIRATRHDLARVLTVQREKAAEAEGGGR